MYAMFLYCAIFLGEVFDFYYVLPYWDIILRFFSGMMLSALGFILVDMLNRNAEGLVSLSPFFESMFAFCFALTLGAVGAICEFSFDAPLEDIKAFARPCRDDAPELIDGIEVLTIGWNAIGRALPTSCRTIPGRWRTA